MSALISADGCSRQPFAVNFSRVSGSLIVVAISNGSPARAGASTKRRNSSDLLQRNFAPRHSMSFKPLVLQFAIVVKTAPDGGISSLDQKSVTIGCRVGSQFMSWVGTTNRSVPTFSPKVKSAQ